MSKKYKGYEIEVEKITGFTVTIFDEKGEVVNDEDNQLHDTLADAKEWAEELIDAITESRST